MSAIQIHPIPAFADNYLWLIHNSQNAVVVDPGDAAPVQAFLDARQLNLTAILLTHHHDDHIGGVVKLLGHAKRNIPVFGPLAEQRSGRIPFITAGKIDGDWVQLDDLALRLQVIEVPGHTSGHIAYHCAQLSALFCGDTLFAGGCGRVFEGTPAQMANSLHKIASLPPDTYVYCAHEYTLSNLRFAMAVEPGNIALQKRFAQVSAARERHQATVPSELAIELATNPFLRCHSPEIIHTLIGQHRLNAGDDDVAVFAALRSWKNSF